MAIQLISATDIQKIIQGQDNVFNHVGEYKDKWEVLSKRQFTEAELACIQKAEVIAGKHGLAVCFHMVGGVKKPINVDFKSTLTVGQEVNAKDLELKVIKNVGQEGLEKCPIGTTMLRVDLVNNPTEEVTSFENPFGI